MDIISNRGDFVNIVKRTLMDLVAKNFVEVNKKKNNGKAKVKEVQELNSKPHVVVNRQSSNIKFSINNIFINSNDNETLEKDDEDESKEENLEETTSESEIKKEKTVQGGYGTVKPYSGTSPYTNYANYNKIWGHLGIFKTNSMFNNTDSNQIAMNNGESSREMVSTETAEKAARHFKYNMVGDVLGGVGYIPPTGANVNSKDWEKYRTMSQMSIYKPIIALLNATV